MNNLRISAGKSLLLLLCWWVLATVVGSMVITAIGTGSIGALRWSVVAQNIFLFVVPVGLTMIMAAPKPMAYVGLETPLRCRVLWLVAAIAVVSIPAMNRLVDWNEHIQLPGSLAAVEQMIRAMEQAAAGTVDRVMSGTSVADLAVSVIVVGVLTGFSEELFFRGALQSLLGGVFRNKHAAIWASAFIFSALHLQFYGFVPRLLMGAYFGYLVMWTGSLWSSVLAHALNNSLVVIASWIDARSSDGFDIDSIGVGCGWQPIALLVISIVLTAIAIKVVRVVSQTSCDRT